MTYFAINDSDLSGQHSVLGTTRMHASAQTLPPTAKGLVPTLALRVLLWEKVKFSLNFQVIRFVASFCCPQFHHFAKSHHLLLYCRFTHLYCSVYSDLISAFNILPAGSRRLLEK